MVDNKQYTHPVDLGQQFLGLQKQMIQTLTANRETITHAVAKGDATEANWLKMLQEYFPKRYALAKAFVVDADGNESQQIDIVVFDCQYSPFLFRESGVLRIPAESVYAVIEVKQVLSRSMVKYAGDKAASVRRLRRTSAPIPHAGGLHEPKAPFHIPAGILTLDSEWKKPLGGCLESAISALCPEERIDFGCVLRSGSFAAVYEDDQLAKLDRSPENESLIAFFLHLLHRLQQLGTVPAIDIAQYASWLTVV